MKSFVAKDGSGEPPSPGRNGEREIFRQIVESYLATGEPLGSRNLRG